VAAPQWNDLPPGLKIQDKLRTVRPAGKEIEMKLRFLLSLCILVAMANRAHSIGMENVGWKELGAANYADIPGLADAVNLPTRVYQSWVNGNEKCFYQADAAQLNVLLETFAAIEADGLELRLRPGIGEVQTFTMHDKQGNIANTPVQITYQAELHFKQGIAAHFEPRPPMLTIFLDDIALLSALNIPEKATVVPPSVVRARLLDALRSEDKRTRGYGAFELAAAEPDTAQNVDAIATLLSDEEAWVRAMAAASLGKLGAHARETLPALRAARDGETTSRQTFQTAIDRLEGAPPAQERSPGEQEILVAIEARWGPP